MERLANSVARAMQRHWESKVSRWQVAPLPGQRPRAPRRPFRGISPITLAIGAVLIVAATLYAAQQVPQLVEQLPLHYNASPSIPRGFYQVALPDTIKKGDLIRACLPAPRAALALERGYLPPGRCAGGTEPLAKIVVGLPGDTVRVDSAGTTIGRVRIDAPVLSMDSKQRPVDAMLGTHVVPAGNCWVMSTFTPDSYDSRYFGAVPCPPPHVVLTPPTEDARLAVDAMRQSMTSNSKTAR